MRLYTLVEEHAADPAFGCEHGLSFYLETEREHLLFDLGQSELFLRNAHTLGRDIARVDRAFLSHGHYDHGGGLSTFLRENDRSMSIPGRLNRIFHANPRVCSQSV